MAVGNLAGETFFLRLEKLNLFLGFRLFVAIFELTIGRDLFGNEGPASLLPLSAALVRKPPARAGTRHIGF